MLAIPESPTRRQHWQAVLVAALCALFFLRDALLPGRAMVPYPPEFLDVRTAEAMAHGTFDPVDTMRGNVSMGDKYNQSLCWDRIMQDRFRAGELPLWTRDIAGGASFVPQMAQVYQPINLLLFVLPSAQWYGWWYFIHLVLFGYFCYRFLRRLGCLHGSALLGVVCAVLGLWTQCKLHHNVILTAALSLWPMLSATHAIALARRTGERVGRAVGWLALWTGLTWMSGFAVVSLQVSYLTIAFAGLLCLGNAQGQRLRPFLLVGVGMALGGLLSLCHMAPVLLASAQSMRNPDFDLSALGALGLDWDHALGALWPDLLSWGHSRFYLSPGPDPFQEPTRMPLAQLVLLYQPIVGGRAIHSWVETQFAIGVPATGCALLALLDRRRWPLVAFFASVAVGAFWLATADQPMLTLAGVLPGLSAADLRRWLFCVSMALVVLAAIGADRVLQAETPWLAVGFLATVAFVSFLASDWLWKQDPDTVFVDHVAHMIAADRGHPQVQLAKGNINAIRDFINVNSKRDADGRNIEAADNLAALQTTALRALLIAGLAAFAMLLRAPPVRLLLAAVLTALELLHTGLGAVQTVPASRVTTPPAILSPILATPPTAAGVRPRLHRLGAPADPDAASLCAPNIPAFHRVEDACAYNPLPPARLEQFFTAIEPDRAGKANVSFGGAGSGPFHDPASLSHPLCDVFGIRFVLTDQAVPTGDTLRDVTPADTGKYRLLERTTTLPRATFVRRIEVEPDTAARLARLADPTRPAGEVVMLEDPRARVPTPAAAGAPPPRVEIIEHRDERVVVRVAASADGYLRLADPYDPGWRATVDGVDAPILPADHYLRAVYLTGGEHEVVFTFDAARVLWPLRASATVFVAILVLLLRRRGGPLP